MCDDVKIKLGVLPLGKATVGRNDTSMGTIDGTTALSHGETRRAKEFRTLFVLKELIGLFHASNRLNISFENISIAMHENDTANAGKEIDSMLDQSLTLTPVSK